MDYPKIFIHSRKSLKAISSVESPCVLIAISDVNSERPVYSFQADEVVEMSFDDVSYQSEVDLVFNLDMSQLIANSIKKYSNLKTVIVSCEMGVSRSAGVAAAIEEYFFNTNNIFDDPRYEPNMLVYKLLTETLQKYEKSR